MTVFSPSANGDMARITWRKRVRHICLAHAPGERIHHSILKELAKAKLVRWGGGEGSGEVGMEGGGEGRGEGGSTEGRS